MNVAKKLLIAGAAIAALAVTLTANAKKNDNITIPDNAVIYDSKDLTYEILSTRTEDITIVERIVGEVLDEDGNGHILNGNEPYTYISYKYVDGAQPGDIIVTYSVFNPENTYEDDIIARYDMIVASDDITR